MPAYLYLDTEGDTVRLKIYEVYDGITAIYVDDTVTGTNRRGEMLVKIWSTNAHGSPPSTPAIYEITVEIYNTNNELRESKKLKYKYVQSNTMFNFKRPDGADLVGIINFVDTQGFFIHYYGSTISFYYEPNAYIEFLRQEGKYYYIGKVSRVVNSPGSYNVIIYPSTDGYIHFYMDIKIDNELLRWVFNTPGVSQFIGFITWLNANVASFELYIASRLLEKMGLSDVRIDKVEVVSTNPFTIRIYMSQDPKPILVALAAIGIFAVGVLVGLIAGGYIVDIVYSVERMVALKVTERIYTEYTNLVSNIINYCMQSYSNDPNAVAQCINEILSKITPPTTSALNTVKEIEDLQGKIKSLEEEMGMWKTLVIVAGIILLAFTLASRGTVVVTR
jgi:hypothetical protein